MGVLIAKYLAAQIIQLKLKYSDVIEKYPKEKDSIDSALKENGMEHLIDKKSE